MGKNYVSYHLMPVYMNRVLQKRISPELKKRMQGKACLNFSEVNPALFRQLTDLTAACFEVYRALKYVISARGEIFYKVTSIWSS